MRKTPRTGKSISIALALRTCVRACVRAKLREGTFPQWLGSARRICGGAPSRLPWWGARKNSKFQSQPFQLQIGLLDFTKMGKAFIDVAPAGRLNFAWKPMNLWCAPNFVGPAGPPVSFARTPGAKRSACSCSFGSSSSVPNG